MIVATSTIAAVLLANGVSPAGPVGAANAEVADEDHGVQRLEIYGTSGLTYFTSDRRLLAGVGGGPGLRLEIVPRLQTYVEGRYLVYLGNAFAGSAGVAYALSIGPWPWEPTIGAQATVVGGDAVTVLTPASPDPPNRFAWAAQLRIAPIRFRHAPFTVSALVTDVGFGDDGGARAFAFALSFLEIGAHL